jgi:SAM-dependent methyltransferase
LSQEILELNAPHERYSTAAPAAATVLGLALPGPEQFARLRALLHEIEYTEAGICARTGCRFLHEYQYGDRAVSTDALAVLIQLFLEGAPVARALVDQLLPAGGPDLLTGFGLLQLDATDPGHYRAPLALYPMHGIYLVSDPTSVVRSKDQSATSGDVVYPAIQATTEEFLSGMPTTPCDRLLDVGAGTGIAALVAAGNFARHAWAVDITERATHACQFNARCNDLGNVTALTGDLFAPVAGMTFDRIVAHPPYMPAAQTRLIFRDGGADGEEIFRRIIHALPDYLEPGGRFYGRTMATDRKDAPLEQRIRDLLGPSHAEFDVVVVSNLDMRPVEFYARLLSLGGMSSAQFDAQMRTFDGFAIERMVVGFVYIQRHAGPQTPITVRRCVTKQSVPAPLAIDWLLDWEHAADDPELSSRLQAARPITTERVLVQLSHRMREGRFQTERCHVATDHPFHFTCESTPATAMLLAASDGSRSVPQLRQHLVQEGVLDATTGMEDFLGIIRMLISGGVLEVEPYPLPR